MVVNCHSQARRKTLAESHKLGPKFLLGLWVSCIRLNLSVSRGYSHPGDVHACQLFPFCRNLPWEALIVDDDKMDVVTLYKVSISVGVKVGYSEDTGLLRGKAEWIGPCASKGELQIAVRLKMQSLIPQGWSSVAQGAFCRVRPLYSLRRTCRKMGTSARSITRKQFSPRRRLQPVLIDLLILERPAVPIVIALGAENKKVDQWGMEEQVLNSTQGPKPADVSHMAGHVIAHAEIPALSRNVVPHKPYVFRLANSEAGAMRQVDVFDIHRIESHQPGCHCINRNLVGTGQQVCSSHAAASYAVPVRHPLSCHP